MSAKLSAVAGALSVIVFLSLAGFLAYDAVTGQAAPQPTPPPEVTRAPGPSPVIGGEPGQAPWDGLVDRVIQVNILLDDVRIECRGGEPYVVIEAEKPLPSGATIILTPHLAPYVDGLVRRPPAGEPQRVALQESVSSAEVALSGFIGTGEYDSLSVFVEATLPDGTNVGSRGVLLTAADVRCGAP